MPKGKSCATDKPGIAYVTWPRQTDICSIGKFNQIPQPFHFRVVVFASLRKILISL